MKKNYIKPEIEMVLIQSESMLAASMTATTLEQNDEDFANDFDIPTIDIWESDEDSEW